MKLTDICDFQGGSQPPKNQWSDEPKKGYIRMLQIRDYTQNNPKIEYIKVTNSTKTCKKDDILIARYGASVGKILTGLSGAYNVAMMKVIINEGKADKDFIYNFLKSSIFQNYIKNVGKRAAQAGFNKEELSKIDISLPTLKEQKNIANRLDKVQEIIELRKKQIEELDELVKSQFVEMFENKNFEFKTLNEVSTIRGEYGSGASAGEYIEGQPRYIRITDIQEDGRLDKNSLASPKNETNINKYILKYGDLLFARTGATVGKTYKYDENDGYCIYAGYCIRFRMNLEICNPDYIFIYTKTDNYKKWVENKQRIVAQPNINAKEYGNDLKIPIPPIEIQNQFAEFVKQINKQKFMIEKSLKEMEEFKESLMNKYFGG